MAGRSAAEVARLVALFAFLGALAAFSRPAPWSVLAGAPLVILGELIRIWSAGHLYKTQELITSGPYRYTRNPLYLGRLLLLTGVGLMAFFHPAVNAAILLAGWAVFFGYYMPRKERIEPARLLSTHGAAYHRYFDAVPALLPTLRPYPDNGERWRMDRFRRNREGLTALGLFLLIVLFALRAFHALP
jgi:protein-S-isoprenylcysteine O-methyltransferase Ste14